MTIFEYIKRSLSILDVVSSYVSLKRMGGYYKGPCPLHSEKDASFTVSPDKNIFYCFGCQVGGDVVAFIASVERLTQGQAVKHLIDRYTLVLPEELQKEMTQQVDMPGKDSLYAVAKACARWAHEQALQNEYVKEYLYARGISDAMMHYFQIGFIPGGVAGLQKCIKSLRSQNILLDDLKNVGIIMDGKGEIYSPFEDRIIFPIKDQLGRYIAFGGRVFLPEDDRARYYNSRESELFSKRQVLYGLDQARKKAQQTGVLFLVEGYMDVIAMVQAGFLNTVATLGTACSLEHLHIMRRFVHTLVLVYDGDKAGQNAIEKVAELCWDVAITLKVVVLPSSEDPASLLQKGSDLGVILQHQEDIFTFLIKKVSKDFFEKPMHEKLELSRKIISMVNHVTNGLKRHLLLQTVSNALQIPLAMLQKMSQQEKSTSEVENSNEQRVQGTEKRGGVDILEEKITAYFFVADRNEAVYLQAYISMQLYWSADVRVLVEQWYQSPVADLQCFLDSLSEKDRQWILSIVMKYGEGISYEIVETLIGEMKKKAWKSQVNRLKQALHKARNEGDSEQEYALMRDFLALKQKMKQ